MKVSDLFAVFMNIGENADAGEGPTIVEVFVEKDNANKLASELREKVRIKWGWYEKELSEYEKKLLDGTVQVIPLPEAIEKIKEEIHDSYHSDTPDY